MGTVMRDTPQKEKEAQSRAGHFPVGAPGLSAVGMKPPEAVVSEEGV